MQDAIVVVNTDEQSDKMINLRQTNIILYHEDKDRHRRHVKGNKQLEFCALYTVFCAYVCKLCRVEQRAPPTFSRAAIALGIGSHF